MENESCPGRPILSIVIPTKDRHDCAVRCIRSLLATLSARCEIVVQDNSLTNRLGSELSIQNNRPTVKYAWNPEKLSITENCDLAVGASSGLYVMLIGDDDTVGPAMESAAVWAKENGADALVPANIAHYYWPGLHGAYSGYREEGLLVIKPFAGRIRKMSVQVGLRELMRNGGLGIVDTLSMPKLYYGLVRRECLENVRRRCSTYFPGLSPDLAAAVALSSFVETIYAVDYPIVLPGSSRNSGAGASARKQHVGQLADQKHLSRTLLKEWPAIVPAVYSVQTLWAATFIQTMTSVGRANELARFNIHKVYGYLSLFNPTLRRSTFNHMKALRAGQPLRLLADILLVTMYLITGSCVRAKVAIAQRLRLKSSIGSVRVSGIENIEEASLVLRQLLSGDMRNPFKGMANKDCL
jgi:hypothetical protein